MKVCHITANHYPFLAAPREYTLKLAEAGVEVDVICLNRGGEPEDEVVDGVRVSRLGVPKGGRLFTLRFVIAASGLLRRREYDIIHVYGHRGCGLLPLLSGRARGKWVLDIRTGSVNRRAWVATLSNLFTRLESYSFGSYIALDAKVGERVLGKGRPLTVVPLGADFSMFKPGHETGVRRELGIKDSETVIIFVSTIQPSRRPEVVLRAFKRLPARDQGPVLLVLGDGVMLETLKREAASLPGGRVVFTGRVPREEVRRYMASSDIGLSYIPMVEQYENQPPLKTAEYMACGLATVATNTSGNRTFINDGVNGILTDDDDGLRESLSTSARDSVLDYDWRSIVERRLLPLYHSMLQA